MTAIAFITTCKGRLQHIQQTLPSLVALAPAEIILVDYNCPDNTSIWVKQHYPMVKVVRVSEDPGFWLARARNLGAAQACSPWLCFIDADIKVNAGLGPWLIDNLKTGYFYRASRSQDPLHSQTDGTFICSREDFIRCQGYDESFRGWGGEDTDLYQRLSFQDQSREAFYPYELIKAIDHADEQRTAFHVIKSVPIQDLINRCYLKAKHLLLHSAIVDIPPSTLEQLQATLHEAFAELPIAPRTYRVSLDAADLRDSQGQLLDITLEVYRRRRYVFFGPCDSAVRLVKRHYHKDRL